MTIKPFHFNLIISILIVCFAFMVFIPSFYAVPIFDFTLDDAFITYRYSENLALGHGPVWNPGEDPVEGYTSFLWMAVNAGFIKAGINPETGSKILSLLLVAAMMIFFAFCEKKAHPLIRLIAVSAVALSPAFILISVQGMETALAAFLATSASLCFLRLIENGSPASAWGFSFLAFLTILTRPDLFIFIGVLLGAAVIHFFRKKEAKPVKVFLIALVSGLIIPGVLYFIWRYNYYGYLLPNTVYVKNTSVTFIKSHLISPAAVIYLRDFIMEITLPFLLLVFLRFKSRAEAPIEQRGRAYILFASGAFLAALLFFMPIQGFLYRYQMPIYPVILLLMLRSFPAKDPLPSLVSGKTATGAGILILLILILFPLHTRDEVGYEIGNRWQYDRVAMGKALSKLKDSNLTMLVTEAGALPYFSKWKALDAVGLNDEYIAHNGLDLNYLMERAPDLVMMIEYIHEDSFIFFHETIYDYLSENGYLLATAVYKTSPFFDNTNESIHFYFVRKESPGAEKLMRLLRNFKKIKPISKERIRGIMKDFGLEGMVD